MLREYLDGRHVGKLGSAGKDSYFGQLEMIGVRMADELYSIQGRYQLNVATQNIHFSKDCPGQGGELGIFLAFIYFLSQPVP